LEFGGAILFEEHNIAFFVKCLFLRNSIQAYLFDTYLLGNKASWHGGALKVGMHSVVNIMQCSMQGISNA